MASGDQVTIETDHRWSEAEDQGKGIVYRSELICIETPHGPPKSLWIYHRSLLNEDSGLGPVE